MDDSDSDNASVRSFVETNVLLGYAEPEPRGDEVSRLGGEPTWLSDRSPADARLAKCGCCNRLMSLLLQLNGAVKESPHERMFYVWACKEKTCRRKKETVKAARCVKVARDWEEKEKEKAKEEGEARARREVESKPKVMGEELFGGNNLSGGGGNANPFSSGPSPVGGAPTNPFSTSTSQAPANKLTKSFSETLRLSHPPEPKPEPEPEPLFYGPAEPWPSPLPHSYPRFYLDAELEALEPDAPPPTAALNPKITEDDTSLPISNATDTDSRLDRAFQKFADRVSQNPEQVLRYERGGLPLLYSWDDEVGKLLRDTKHGEVSMKKVPPCGNCRGRERVFELQIMPHAIAVLEGGDAGFDGMEWGTIIVGTCLCVPKARDAEGVGWVEEWVGVQWEAQR